MHFAVVRLDEGTFGLAKMIPVAGFRLPNQRALIVLTSSRTNEPGRDQWLRDMAVYGLVLKQGNHVTHFGDPLRIGLFARDDEDRGVWDLRAPQREDQERVNREGLTVNKTFTPTPTGSEKKNDGSELTLLFLSTRSLATVGRCSNEHTPTRSPPGRRSPGRSGTSWLPQACPFSFLD
jgi:hypothetical protein